MNSSRKIRRMAPTAVLEKCGQRCIYLQDRLSELPDCLIIFILSRLPMKEAARTSVLSCRWRCLWTYAIRALDFDASQLVLRRLRRSERNNDSQLLECLQQLGSAYSSSLDFERNKFIEWVNKVLESHNAPTIDEFRVFFDLGEHRYRPYIDSWISLALKKSVRRLELNLSWSYGQFCPGIYLLTLPLLQNCKLDSLACIILNAVEVTQEVFEYILSCCPLLECLTVVTSASLVNLKVSGPTLKLKHLKIFYCYNIRFIEISAPCLVSFKLHGSSAKINFKDVPSLVALSLSVKNLPLNSWPILFQLRTLALDMIQLDLKLCRFPMLPKLRNLIEFKLELFSNQIIEVLCFMSPLKAFPMLHRLSIKVFNLEYSPTAAELRKLKMKAKHAHKHLKVIELSGFRGKRIESEIIWYIINNTVALEKIVIDPSFLPLEEGLRHFPTRKVKEAVRTRARQLGESFPPEIELVIL